MRILVDERVYGALGSNAFSEGEYEDILRDRSKLIYPEWELVPFKPLVQSPHGDRHPDLALIAPDYSDWWVVEVELAHHSLHAHVLPQVEAFHDGHYGHRHVDKLLENLPSNDRPEVERMIREVHPRVHVVVNEDVSGWIAPLSQYDVALGIVEVFRGDRDQIALRVSGTMPVLRTGRRSRCVRDITLKNAFNVMDATLAAQLPSEFEMTIDGHITFWRRPSPLSHLILPMRADPFENRNSFVVFREADGRLTSSKKQPDV